MLGHVTLYDIILWILGQKLKFTEVPTCAVDQVIHIPYM